VGRSLSGKGEAAKEPESVTDQYRRISRSVFVSYAIKDLGRTIV
jgi:hypothetical protein